MFPCGVCSGKETPFLTPKSAARFITSRLALGSHGESQSSLFQKMGWVCFSPRKTTDPGSGSAALNRHRTSWWGSC